MVPDVIVLPDRVTKTEYSGVDIAFQTRRLERTFNSKMITAANQYNPDYAVPPGWVLEEELEAKGISQSQFARLCGVSAKLIREIIAGKAPIELETASQFGRVLGGGPDIWFHIESTYRLRLAQQEERL